MRFHARAENFGSDCVSPADPELRFVEELSAQGGEVLRNWAGSGARDPRDPGSSVRS
jgi:hypothetical protein